MMDFAPEKRATAKEMLTHPWLEGDLKGAIALSKGGGRSSASARRSRSRSKSPTPLSQDVDDVPSSKDGQHHKKSRYTRFSDAPRTHGGEGHGRGSYGGQRSRSPEDDRRASGMARVHGSSRHRNRERSSSYTQSQSPSPGRHVRSKGRWERQLSGDVRGSSGSLERHQARLHGIRERLRPHRDHPEAHTSHNHKRRRL